jgi:hypothetical protein
MTAVGMTFMGENSQTLRPRQRLGWLLRSMYAGTGGAKRLARDVGVSEKTARNLFDDHWPGDDTFAAIVRRLGDDVWRVVLAPEIAPVLAELQEQEARLERELQAIQARRRAVGGLAERRTFGLAPAEDQADPAQLTLPLDGARP